MDISVDIQGGGLEGSAHSRDTDFLLGLLSCGIVECNYKNTYPNMAEKRIPYPGKQTDKACIQHGV